MNKVELCLNLVSALDWIDGVVIGVDNLQQLNENIRIMSEKNTIDLDNIFKSRPIVSEKSLNPANWEH